MKKWICLFFLSFLRGLVIGEVFTSMTDMSRLLTTEGELIRTIENYITAQEKRLHRLKRYEIPKFLSISYSIS